MKTEFAGISQEGFASRAMMSTCVAQGREDRARDDRGGRIIANRRRRRGSPDTPEATRNIRVYAPAVPESRRDATPTSSALAKAWTHPRNMTGTLLLDYVFGAGVEQAREHESAAISFRSTFGDLSLSEL